MGDLLKRIQKLEKSSPSRIEHSGHPTINEPSEADAQQNSDSFAHRAPSSSQQGWQTVLDKSRDWGRSRWISKAPEFATMIRCYGAIMGRDDDRDASFQDPEVAALILQAGDLLQNCKNRAKKLKASRPTRNAPSPGPGLAPPSREMADEMVRLYFESFESMFVFISKIVLPENGSDPGR